MRTMKMLGRCYLLSCLLAVDALRDRNRVGDQYHVPSVGLVGAPNVGKTSILNTLLRKLKRTVIGFDARQRRDDSGASKVTVPSGVGSYKNKQSEFNAAGDVGPFPGVTRIVRRVTVSLDGASSVAGASHGKHTKCVDLYDAPGISLPRIDKERVHCGLHLALAGCLPVAGVTDKRGWFR